MGVLKTLARSLTILTTLLKVDPNNIKSQVLNSHSRLKTVNTFIAMGNDQEAEKISQQFQTELNHLLAKHPQNKTFTAHHAKIVKVLGDIKNRRASHINQKETSND